MYESVTSLEELINYDDYVAIKDEINSFLKKVISDSIGNIDTIVGLNRKGIWILKDYFHDNPNLKKFNVVSENKIQSNLVNDQNILLFDDSVRSGGTISKTIDKIDKFNPKSVTVFCLLINNKAYKNIKKKYNIKIHYCQKFPTYPKQSKKYMEWEIVYISGLRFKDNPDYPILKMRTYYDDLNKLYDYFIDSLKNNFLKNFDEFSIDSVADMRNSLTMTVDIDVTDKSLLKPYESIITEIDGYKLRWFMATFNGFTEIKFVSLLNPRYDPTRCDIWKKSPTDCFYKIYNLKKSVLTCKSCVPILLNYNVLENMQQKVLPKIRKNRIILENIELRMPEIQRFNRLD